MRQRPLARISLYRVNPRACQPSSALAAIAACTRETPTYGLGLTFNVLASSLDCRCYFIFGEGARCPICTAYNQALNDRVDVARAIGKKFKLTVWRAPRHSLQAAKLHVCRGPATKTDVECARRARAATATMLRALGYTVELTNDDGGVELLKPTKKWRLRA